MHVATNIILKNWEDVFHIIIAIRLLVKAWKRIKMNRFKELWRTLSPYCCDEKTSDKEQKFKENDDKSSWSELESRKICKIILVDTLP